MRRDGREDGGGRGFYISPFHVKRRDQDSGRGRSRLGMRLGTGSRVSRRGHASRAHLSLQASRRHPFGFPFRTDPLSGPHQHSTLGAFHVKRFPVCGTAGLETGAVSSGRHEASGRRGEKPATALVWFARPSRLARSRGPCARASPRACRAHSRRRDRESGGLVLGDRAQPRSRVFVHGQGAFALTSFFEGDAPPTAGPRRLASASSCTAREGDTKRPEGPRGEARDVRVWFAPRGNRGRGARRVSRDREDSVLAPPLGPAGRIREGVIAHREASCSATVLSRAPRLRAWPTSVCAHELPRGPSARRICVVVHRPGGRHEASGRSAGTSSQRTRLVRAERQQRPWRLSRLAWAYASGSRPTSVPRPRASLRAAHSRTVGPRRLGGAGRRRRREGPRGEARDGTRLVRAERQQRPWRPSRLARSRGSCARASPRACRAHSRRRDRESGGLVLGDRAQPRSRVFRHGPRASALWRHAPPTAGHPRLRAGQKTASASSCTAREGDTKRLEGPRGEARDARSGSRREPAASHEDVRVWFAPGGRRSRGARRVSRDREARVLAPPLGPAGRIREGVIANREASCSATVLSRGPASSGMAHERLRSRASGDMPHRRRALSASLLRRRAPPGRATRSVRQARGEARDGTRLVRAERQQRPWRPSRLAWTRLARGPRASRAHGLP
jgi:hypothetical protein